MANTNNAEAGPSTTSLKREPSLELAGNVQVYKSSRLEDCLDYSILVNNNISMARDQLANERNWLTWFRLSCTLIILGFSILIKFRLPDNSDNEDNKVYDVTSKPVGLTFCVIGFFTFFVGIGKYFKNQRLLVKQATYVEAGWGSYLIVGLIFLFVCSVMIMASLSSSQALVST